MEDYEQYEQRDVDSEIHVADIEFLTMGYEVEVVLHVNPGRGRYWIAFTRLDGTQGDVAWEPSEPDPQRIGVKYARDNPLGAVRELLEIDQRQRAE
jgi:hypothetical protein